MTANKNLKILLLAHDLADAAIARRASMLGEGGASVTVAGFRRTSEPISTVAGFPAIDFGQTFSAGFIQRIIAVLRLVLGIRKHRDLFAWTDVIIARNLEMLAIGVRGRSLVSPTPVLVYECLDIHRLLLRRDFIGGMLRGLEGWLSRRASGLITSSPAFITDYFNSVSQVKLPVRLIENKMPASAAGAVSRPRTAGPPWRIGWFGVIRCRKSLKILTNLARNNAGSIEVVIRGRPALDQFDNFPAEVANIPGLKFLGPYKNPDDLAAIYHDVHFTWAIDMFEEGQNSSWLLPNRLYEGGAFGAIPIAQESVETGRFLRRHNMGVPLKEPLAAELESFFRSLTPERYQMFENASRNIPLGTWIYDKKDSLALVEYLRSLSGTENV